MSDNVRTVILGDLETNSLDRSSLIKALEYGERLGDNEVVGQAYYKILLLGRSVWNDELNMSANHRQCLKRGFIKLCELCDRIAQLWDSTYKAHQTCRPDPGHASRVWCKIAASKLPSYDVLGRLRCILTVSHSTPTCDSKIKTLIRNDIGFVNSMLYGIFTNPFERE
jgi:hypothetical protein